MMSDEAERKIARYGPALEERAFTLPVIPSPVTSQMDVLMPRRQGAESGRYSNYPTSSANAFMSIGLVKCLSKPASNAFCLSSF